ncbi:hypothetical protein PHLGIDRAFT_144244 [Phlebiopsis gigantea 11061_1 CR5-6]|uniref:Uncharacterized protein n=1 Tax=Phlebiopsis gigantea (strain 11061_1 CR5-6) TaxID=745531 RepID=A0A0C3S5K3_PHLG1|nr:hypothetical protein PHLGIDRAFT_144244 [Phlebiopsis gigantea 11061_1 CR5-6]
MRTVTLSWSVMIASNVFQELKSLFQVFLHHALNFIPEKLLSSIQYILKRLTACNPKDYLKELLTWLRAKAAELTSWTYRHRKPILCCLLALAIVITIIYMPTVVTKVIHAIGFQSKGVVADSFAAHFQSTFCGPYIERGSLFATLQSIGAGGNLNLATLFHAAIKAILSLSS